MRLTPPGRRIKLQETVLQLFTDLHDSSLVATPVTVVRGTEDGDYVAVVTPVVSLHHKLMRARHEGQTIDVIELLGDVLSEGVACASRRNTPAASIIRIRPQQIAHGPLVRHFLYSVLLHDMVEGVDGGGKAAVQTEDLFFDEGSEGEIVKEISEVPPHAGVPVFAEAFIVESVYLCDLTTLVVAAEDGDAILVSDLKSDKKRHDLNRVIPSIDVVTHE